MSLSLLRGELTAHYTNLIFNILYVIDPLRAFPAEIAAPNPGQGLTASSGTVGLRLEASSVIGDTSVNDGVYFGTVKSPAI
jgi:hypothetical protein